MSNLILKHFFDPQTNTLSYVVHDPKTLDAVMIDPVLDYDPAASQVSTESIDKAFEYIQKNNLKIHFIMETHAHADHLTGAQALKNKIASAKVVIGEHISTVQEKFKDVFNMKDLNTNGIQFDELLKEGQEYSAGSIKLKVLYTPGHTPACSSYLIDDMAFTGDTLFMPDLGTGRCDFPGGSSKDMYRSIHEKLYQLPDNTKVFVGHDYPPETRDVKYCTTIAEQKKTNKMLKEETSEADYIKARTERDQRLGAPRLLLQSLQINIEAGHFPKAEDNNKRYLKIPLK